MKVTAIIPSKIDSHQRWEWSKSSMLTMRSSGFFAELDEAVVVDDSLYAYKEHSKDVYQGCKFIDGKGQGMTWATIEALDASSNDYCFIHLDDMVYWERAKDLLSKAKIALNANSIGIIHFSNYPLIDEGTTLKGNTNYLQIESEFIKFDGGLFKPQRYENFTLWTSPLKTNMIDGPYWPAAMWFAIYKKDILRKMLTSAYAAGKNVLGGVETFYRDHKNWDTLCFEHEDNPIGYINMQFGGFEFHRNARWKEIVASPNIEVR